MTSTRFNTLILAAALLSAPLTSWAQHDGGTKGFMLQPCSVVQEDFKSETGEYVARESAKFNADAVARTADFTVKIAGSAPGFTVNYEGPDGSGEGYRDGTILAMDGYVMNVNGFKRARIACIRNL